MPRWLKLREWAEGKISGKRLLEVAKKARRAMDQSGLVEARRASQAAANALYLRLAQRAGPYSRIKRNCGAFNRELGGILELADYAEDKAYFVAGRKKSFGELTGDEITDLFYRPSRLEAHHIVKGSFFDEFKGRFEKLAEVIARSDEGFGDAGFWLKEASMPALPIEAELHTVSPIRIKELFDTTLPFEKGFSKAFDDKVEALMNEGGTRTLAALFDAHAKAYQQMMKGPWLEQTISLGERQVTILDYLESRRKLAAAAGL